ncbi:MAG: hypothetical protein DRQ46_00480 [Gammaproteobacteria bacterium]|nr:MAG: hypothetical protein DRQ46_00480 [Gammaproteobacteria bacterium]
MAKAKKVKLTENTSAKWKNCFMSDNPEYITEIYDGETHIATVKGLSYLDRAAINKAALSNQKMYNFNADSGELERNKDVDMNLEAMQLMTIHKALTGHPDCWFIGGDDVSVRKLDKLDHELIQLLYVKISEANKKAENIAGLEQN